MTAKNSLQMSTWAVTLGVLLAIGCNSVPPDEVEESGGSGGSGGSSTTGGKGGKGGKGGNGGKGGGADSATGGSAVDEDAATGGGAAGDDESDGPASDSDGSGGSVDARPQDALSADTAGRQVNPLPMCTEPNKGLDPTKLTIAAPLNCKSPGLVWHTANMTNYDSNPAPGSEECDEYNGCFWAGKFNTCGDCLVKTKAWIKAHKVVAMYPLKNYGLHSICIKQGSKLVEVTVYDTCGNADCDNCCTQNKGSADALIDIEKQTLNSTGLSGEGSVTWADLGYKGATCTDTP